MELNNINRLIEKYLDGETSLNEERAIATYLATAESLPKEHIAVKAMFEAMGELRKVTAPQSKPQKRTLSLVGLGRVAAVVACLVVSLFFATRTITNTPLQAAEPMIICYVDGARVDNPQIAEMEARRILGNMNENINNAMEKINKVNTLNIK
jgi:hypothetical protein